LAAGKAVVTLRTGALTVNKDRSIGLAIKVETAIGDIPR
jgi:hypothetical protein